MFAAVAGVQIAQSGHVSAGDLEVHFGSGAHVVGVCWEVSKSAGVSEDPSAVVGEVVICSDPT